MKDVVEYHGKAKNGRLVKRLRHQPLTLKTWVRFPYRSPAHRKHHICGAFLFCVLVTGTRNLTQHEHAPRASCYGFAYRHRRYTASRGAIRHHRYSRNAFYIFIPRSRFPYLFAARGDVFGRRSALFFLRLTSPRQAIYRIRGMHQECLCHSDGVLFFILWWPVQIPEALVSR